MLQCTKDRLHIGNVKCLMTHFVIGYEWWAILITKCMFSLLRPACVNKFIYMVFFYSLYLNRRTSDVEGNGTKRGADGTYERYTSNSYVHNRLHGIMNIYIVYDD